MSDKARKELQETLDECLELMQCKLRRGHLTTSDLRALLNAITAGGGVIATVSDIADLYGQSTVNVRSVIKRRILNHPIRRVYYDFGEFQKAAPKTWHVKGEVSDTCE